MLLHPRKITDDDLKILVECFKEHDRLENEAKKLSDAALAEKFEVTHQCINKYRVKLIGRKSN